MKKLMLLLPTTGYRNEDFLTAAQELNAEIIPVANYCHELAPLWGMAPLMAVPFDQPHRALTQILNAVGDVVPDAVLAVDDLGLTLASLLSAHFGLLSNPPEAVQILRDKLLFRQFLSTHGFPAPVFVHVNHIAQLDKLNIAFPVVVKPRRLSGSRGVIRANNQLELEAAVRRVQHIQKRADREAVKLGVIVESFLSGDEIALEGIMVQGTLHILAVFDKPDPLNGPFFEETLYLTPSRLPPRQQEFIRELIEAVSRLCGIHTGPIHAEARVNTEGVWLLEIAPRSIGGLCGRVLRHSLGMSLEELILRNALQLTLPQAARGFASGVMMIPIPKRGVFLGVDGLERARSTPHISDIQISAKVGQVLVTLPEGASYLGFIFARGPSTDEVEQALRNAHAALRFTIAAEVPLYEAQKIS